MFENHVKFFVTQSSLELLKTLACTHTCKYMHITHVMPTCALHMPVWYTKTQACVRASMLCLCGTVHALCYMLHTCEGFVHVCSLMCRCATHAMTNVHACIWNAYIWAFTCVYCIHITYFYATGMYVVTRIAFVS